MKEKLNSFYKFTDKYALFILMLLGVFSRAFLLGKVPGGLNQDEAFSAYEAFSLLTTGTDSAGYSFPVYLNTWGSGMNALYCYMTIPFVALFGLHVWVIRIPQFLVSCLSLYVFYRLLWKLFDRKAGLLGLFFLAICPWHIMISRWGLESNLAPGFLLFAFYFFLLGVDSSVYYICSAVFYGLSLYCYAAIWPIVPLMIVLQFAYVIYTKKMKWDRHVLTAGILLFLFAFPLVLFLLINKGYIHEIRTPLLSIPKLTTMRESDISLQHIPLNFIQTRNVLIYQNDGAYWNYSEVGGLYYGWFLGFFVMGAFACLFRAFRSLKTKKYDPYVLLLVIFGCPVLMGCVILTNINRINSIHISVIALIVSGMYLVCRAAKKYANLVAFVLVVCLCTQFVKFELFYNTAYNENIKVFWESGFDQALFYAMEKADGDTISIYSDIAAPNYSKVLFYTRYPSDVYRQTVTYYDDYPSTSMYTRTFGNFVFHYLDDEAPGNICVISRDKAWEFSNAGYQVTLFDTFAVAEMK